MGFTEVELPFSTEQMVAEGTRCLRCNYNIFWMKTGVSSAAGALTSALISA